MTSPRVNMSTSQHEDAARDDGYLGRFRGDMLERTFEFGCAVIDIVDELPSNVKGWNIAKQLIRCGTSIGANVAEADHAISDAEFIQRCSIARKEAAETRYWLRICRAKNLASEESTNVLLPQVEEILRILTTIIRRWQAK